MIINKKTRNYLKKIPNSAFWIGGKHSVLTAVHNPKRKIYQIILHEKFKGTENTLIQSHKEKVLFKSDNFFNKIFKFQIPHQGFAVLIDKINQQNFKDFINEKININKILNIVALDGVNDQRNIGSIIRSACAFEIDAMLLNSKDYNSKSFFLYKSASGAADIIPVFEVSNILNEINFLKKQNFYVIGMDSNADTNLYNFKFQNRNLIIFGSEENGLKNIINNNCDITIKIPISKNMESLNVSNACAATFAILNYIQNKKPTLD